ncbi:sulfurtransferase TusE [Bacterioplanes sanyensis]|uniref:Sulfurtransferase n=1 Tax=Bacterioplanes sanyensis TaxID=1249553 RepID=A0A222FLX4_9GAMM|nr:TusE/DsrC/DsvC family sulfur relay protein [Bacterioplanes sanyensis]ASP39780.1 sulfurtransferase TusE [Bacterioplanes sanyensis]
MAELDSDGFLKNLDDWSPEVATELAQDEGIELTPAHWEIVHLLRDFYQQYDLAPAMRPLTKYIRSELGADKARSIYLLSLFPGSPAKVAARIAGLPRPENCL